jgi:DNA-binding HxlR family transcriptional regulator
MRKMQRDKVEDAVLRALGHEERRKILRIIESNTEGVRYSDILVETGLTTSKLNYQLRELDGFIGKEEQMYVLTELGRKAVGVLDYMGEDMEKIDIGPTVEGERRRYVKNTLNKVFLVAKLSISVGPLVTTYFYLFDPSSNLTGRLVLLVYALCGLTIYGLDKVRQGSPEYIVSFAEWLDWKFFNWRGSDEFRGRKTFILTALGFTLGLLFGHAGAGLLIGLFLGAVMEI